MPCKPFLQFSPSEVEKVLSVNVLSQYWTLMEFLPRMASLRKGHVVSMCSMAGVTGTPNLVPYCSSKFAVKDWFNKVLHAKIMEYSNTCGYPVGKST